MGWMDGVDDGVSVVGGGRVDGVVVGSGWRAVGWGWGDLGSWWSGCRGWQGVGVGVGCERWVMGWGWGVDGVRSVDRGWWWSWFGIVE